PARAWTTRCSTESERVDARARLREADLEHALAVALLADELVQALAVDAAVPVGVDVAAGVLARRLAVEGDAEAQRAPVAAWCHHQVQVAAAETDGEGRVGASRLRVFGFHLPLSRERPLVRGQLRRPLVVPSAPLGEELVGEALGVGMAQVGLGRAAPAA